MSDLPQKHKDALWWLHSLGGSVLVSRIENTDDTDVIGGWTPGLNRFKKLESLDLVYITEEEPLDLGDDEPFEFTPSIEFTVKGRELVKSFG